MAPSLTAETPSPSKGKLLPDYFSASPAAATPSAEKPLPRRARRSPTPVTPSPSKGKARLPKFTRESSAGLDSPQEAEGSNQHKEFERIWTVSSFRDRDIEKRYENSQEPIWFMITTKFDHQTNTHYFDSLKEMPLGPARIPLEKDIGSDSSRDEGRFAQVPRSYEIDHIFELSQIAHIMDKARKRHDSDDAYDHAVRNAIQNFNEHASDKTNPLREAFREKLNDVKDNACGVDKRVNSLKNTILRLYPGSRLTKEWGQWHRTEAAATLDYLRITWPKYLKTVHEIATLLHEYNDIFSHHFEEEATVALFKAARVIFVALFDIKKWKKEFSDTQRASSDKELHQISRSFIAFLKIFCDTAPEDAVKNVLEPVLDITEDAEDIVRCFEVLDISKSPEHSNGDKACEIFKFENGRTIAWNLMLSALWKERPDEMRRFKMQQAKFQRDRQESE